MSKIRKFDTGKKLIPTSFTFFVKKMIKFVGKNIGSYQGKLTTYGQAESIMTETLTYKNAQNSENYIINMLKI